MPSNKRSLLSDNWKAKIRVGVLMQRLLDHSVGKVEMSPTQVRALEIVLRKLVPDLASTTSDVKITYYTEFLERIAALDAAPAQVGERSADQQQVH